MISLGASSPLLEEIVELDAGKNARALLAPLKPGSVPAQARVAALELEQLAALASVLVPGKRLVSVEEASRKLDSETRREGQHWGLAYREGLDGIRCTVHHGSRVDVGNNLLDLRIRVADAAPVQPALVASERRALEVLQGHDASALYEACARFGDVIPDPLHLIDWATRLSPSHLVAGMRSRPVQDGVNEERALLPTGAIDGAVQLAEWLWLAFSGQRARAAKFARLHWYRLPRFDEVLLAEVRLQGAPEGEPQLDARVLGDGRDVLLLLQGLRLQPVQDSVATTPPRLAWSQFVRQLTTRPGAGR